MNTVIALIWLLSSILLIVSIVGYLGSRFLTKRNYSKWSKKVQVTFAVFFISLIVFILLFPKDDTNKEPTIEDRQVELEKIADKIWGKDLIKVKFENNNVVIVHNLKSNLTKNFMRDRFSLDAFRFLDEIKDLDYVDRVQVAAYAMLTDAYGNEKNDKVLDITLSKETRNKINYDNFDKLTLPNIADSYFEHPTFNR